MDSGSRINPLLTLRYMQTENENKYFDRKSGQIRVADLAPHISAFANADGGTLVIGISDRGGRWKVSIPVEMRRSMNSSMFRRIVVDRCRGIEKNSLT